jgi:hypothetical protein
LFGLYWVDIPEFDPITIKYSEFDTVGDLFRGG